MHSTRRFARISSQRFHFWLQLPRYRWPASSSWVPVKSTVRKQLPLIRRWRPTPPRLMAPAKQRRRHTLACSPTRSGCRQSFCGLPLYTVRDSRDRMLISQVMKAMSKNRSVEVTRGEQTRDFIYVEDVVKAIIRSLTVSSAEGEVWNVGSGEVVTVRDCLERIERITGRTGLIEYGKRSYSENEIFQYELQGARDLCRVRLETVRDSGRGSPQDVGILS